MSAAERIAFIKSGEFSHININVLEQLRAQFPTAQIDVIDIGELPALQRAALPLTALRAFTHYGPRALASLAAIRKFGVRTPEHFAAVRAQLGRRLAGHRYGFTFQTQTRIGADQPGIPHFIYTDHTHLANLYYPGVSDRDLYCRAWIEAERGLYERTRVTFTMSTHVSRSLREHYGIDESRMQCVGVGSNLAYPDSVPLDAARYAAKRILFVGVDWERKGGPQLLAAFRQLRVRHPDATLTVVGCSPRIDEPRCEVLGRLPLDAVAEQYRRASIFCLPTRNEPFGIVFLEAFAYRLPVVATDLGALPDMVQEGVSGYLVAPDDIATLAARLDLLLGDAARCRALGVAGFEAVRERYTWAHTGQLMGDRIRRELG